jgi:hypothetical protein
MILVTENSIETFEGIADDAKAFAARLRGKFPCFIAMAWNGSFHASEYQIVAVSELRDCDEGSVAVSVSCAKDARNAFLMLTEERREKVRIAFKNSREYEYAL